MMTTCVRHYVLCWLGSPWAIFKVTSWIWELLFFFFFFFNTCQSSIYSSCNNIIFRQVPFSARNVSAIIGGISDSIFVWPSAIPVTNAAGTTDFTPDGYYTIMYTTDPQDSSYLHAELFYHYHLPALLQQLGFLFCSSSGTSVLKRFESECGSGCTYMCVHGYVFNVVLFFYIYKKCLCRLVDIDASFYCLVIYPILILCIFLWFL